MCTHALSHMREQQVYYSNRAAAYFGCKKFTESRTDAVYLNPANYTLN